MCYCIFSKIYLYRDCYGSDSSIWFVFLSSIFLFYLLQIMSDMKMLQEGASIGCTQSRYSMVLLCCLYLNFKNSIAMN